MATSVNKKINHIFVLLERLSKGEELYSQDANLQQELGVDKRTIDRYLKDIHELYSHIVTTEKKSKEFTDRKVTVFRVVDKERDVSRILRFFIENSKDLDWLLALVNENDPTLLREMEDRQELECVLKREEHVFLFKTNPFEHMENDTRNKLFSRAKTAVKSREYRNIRYRYGDVENIENAKCLKMVFMSNNWYLAVEEEDGQLRFLRLSFVESIDYARNKGSYHLNILDKYTAFFQKLQNPMTLDVPWQTARILAGSRIAKYFREEMKPFFPSQRFIRENADGSIDFSIAYTQPLEILPFIKQWQPDLTILEPESLRETLRQDLQKSLENHTK